MKQLGGLMYTVCAGGGACGICYEFFTILTSTTLAAKTTDA
jgi:ferredoxin